MKTKTAKKEKAPKKEKKEKKPAEAEVVPAAVPEPEEAQELIDRRRLRESRK